MIQCPDDESGGGAPGGSEAPRGLAMAATPKLLRICPPTHLAVAPPVVERARAWLAGEPFRVSPVALDPVLLVLALQGADDPEALLALLPDRLEPSACTGLKAALDRLPATEPGVVDPLSEWRHAYATAVGAQRLLGWRGEAATGPAYAAGLLHDLGRRVLAHACPEALAAAHAEGGLRGARAREAEHCGVDHAEAGGRALATWGLPRVLAAAARHHHGGPPEGHPHAAAVAAVTVANRLAALFYAPETGERTNVYAAERLGRSLMGVSPEVLEEVVAGMASAVQEAAFDLGLEGGEPERPTRRLVEANLKVSRIHLELERSRRTLEERLEQMRLLAEVSEWIQRETDQEILCRGLVGPIARLLRAERVSILLRGDHLEGEMALVAGHGLPPEAYAAGPVREGHGISGYVAEHGEVVVVRDLATDERFEPSERAGDYASGSFVSCPINVGERTVGIIHVSGRRGSPAFEEPDVACLTTIAHQLSIALETRCLLQRLAERNARLEEANREIQAVTRAVEEGRNKLSSILRSMGEGVVVCRPSREITLVNAAAEAILGQEGPDLLGSDLADCGNPVLESVAELLPELRRRRGATLEETTRVDGRTIRLNLAPLHDPDGRYRGTVIVLQDTTRLVAAEKARAAFVSHVSHELRTPLVSINGFASTILRDPEMDEETRNEFLQIIVSEGTRLTRLIDNLLELSRAEQGALALERVPVALDRLVPTAAEGLLKVAEERQVTIESAVAEGLPEVSLDEDRIRQVLVNLLSNAIKFSPPGGRVRVAAELAGSEVRVSVSDQGPGIPEHLRERVFDRFFQVRTADRATQGTGLGLAIVREIVEAHGGRVWVEEADGGGARLCFTLPVEMDEPNP
ncbi:MAG: HDOD domain-containing protein [Nitrospirae bacterium]|nr:MAG: HDOD domain-containing protein [Nitrospirota bacterium]